MGPKKGQGEKKGKQPAKRKAPARVVPAISSSDEEDWPNYSAILAKLRELERKRALAREDSRSATAGRSRRESKACKMAKLKQIGEVMMSRIALLEKECSTGPGAADCGHWNTGGRNTGRQGDDTGPVPGPTPEWDD